MDLQFFRYILVGLLLYGQTFYAQKTDTIQQLKEVVVSDVKLLNNTTGIKIQKLTDSILENNSTNLTTLLRFNSNIFIRELGIGGTSTVSFRGTSASQTAVVWNGLNINSQSSGQTDFNTVSVQNYDAIDIRSGGGSIGYGSGAVGGSIHLNSDFKFNKHLQQRLITSLASYNTVANNYKVSMGNKKLYGSLAIDYTQSKNNYLYLSQKGKKNENADFENYNFNYDVGYRFNGNHVLKVFNNTYLGTRNFSNTLFTIANDGYENRNSRHMFQYLYIGRKVTSTLSAAYLYEKYIYTPNTENSRNSDYGKSENATLKYDFNYTFSNNIQLKAIAQYEHISGEGTNIESVLTPRASLAFLYSHKINPSLDYSFNLRQEINDFENFSFSTFFEGIQETYSNVVQFNKNNTKANNNPFVISLGSNYKLSDSYILKFNASKNFRTPTFNDLYWSGQGNPDLKPEKSVQAEITNEFNYKGFNWKVTGFYIKSKYLITWRPDTFGIWKPINVDKVYNYGLESEMSYQKQWGAHVIQANLNANYIISEDKDSGEQLLYKPRHIITQSISYNYKRLGFFYQFSWVDDTYISTDKSRKIDAYDVSNIGFNYRFYSNTNKDYSIGLTANNVYNEVYFLDAGRPAPNRNYKLQLILKF